MSWAAYSLRKAWNAAKDEVAPWWVGNSKESYASGLANLATALDNWNKSRKGQRGGRRVGFPRFKSKRHRASCRFTTGAFGLSDQDRRHVKLPRIGLVRTHESTRKLARHVERGTARTATLHTRVANARRNGLHKLSPRLVDEFDTVVVEDLNVAGMTRNHRLARHISDVGMGELRRQLDYKTGWNSRALVVADRWYPSSKTCNDCGAVKTKLRLNQRVFTCDHCGHAADRDLNAARNLAGLASPHSWWATENEPDGNPRKTTPGGGGYRHGKAPTETGTNAAPQGDGSGTFLHVS